MNVNFRTSPKDHHTFLREFFFKWNLRKRWIWILLIAAWFGSVREGNTPFVFSIFLLKFIIYTCLLLSLVTIVPLFISKIRQRKMSEAEYGPHSLTADINGLKVESAQETDNLTWERVDTAEVVGEYIYIKPFVKRYFLIPLASFPSENEAHDFFDIVKNGMRSARGNSQPRKVRNLYRWSLLGLLPNVGLIAGIVILIRGISFEKRGLILVGLADIAFTFVFWFAIFPLLFRPNSFSELTRVHLSNLVKSVEFYKIQHGQYPESLEQVMEDDKLVQIHDHTQVDLFSQGPLYNYERVGNNYHLYSSGPDKMQHTKDDIFPDVHISDSSKIGLIIP